MNNALQTLILASSLTINSPSVTTETTQSINQTKEDITTTLDKNLPAKEFQRQSDLNVINSNWEYFIIKWDKESWYKMYTTNIKNIPDEAVCKNYSWEPVFYVWNTEIKELGSWEEEKIWDDKFSEFQNMPSCDTAWAKNLASN